MPRLTNSPIRATDTNNAPVSGAVLSVYNSGTLDPVTIYSDSDLSTSLGTSLSGADASNSDGYFRPVYVPAGSYRIDITHATESFPAYPIDDVEVIDPDAVSSVTPLGGNTARSLDVKFGELLSLKDFGAVIDGATNDTAAVQAAVNYAATEGVALLHPGGTCMISSQINLGDSLPLLYGAHASVCKFAFTDTSGAHMFARETPSSGDFRFEGIGFDGNGANKSDGAILYVKQANSLTVHNCLFENARSRFVLIADDGSPPSDYGVVYLTIRDSIFKTDHTQEIEELPHAIQVDSVRFGLFEGLEISDIRYGSGVQVYTSDRVTIKSCSIQQDSSYDNEYAGVRVTSASPSVGGNATCLIQDVRVFGFNNGIFVDGDNLSYPVIADCKVEDQETHCYFIGGTAPVLTNVLGKNPTTKGGDASSAGHFIVFEGADVAGGRVDGAHFISDGQSAPNRVTHCFHEVNGADNLSYRGIKIEAAGVPLFKDKGLGTKYEQRQVVNIASWVAGQRSVLDHDLVAFPDRTRVSVVCQTAEHDFDVGDVVEVGHWSDGAAEYGVTLMWRYTTQNSEPVWLIEAQVGPNGIRTYSRTDGSIVDLTPANWSLKFDLEVSP